MEPLRQEPLKGSALPQATVVKKKGITIEKTVIENYYTVAQTVHINNKEYSVKCFFPKSPKYGEKDLFQNPQINSKLTRKLQETIVRMTEYAIVFGLGNDENNNFSSIIVQGDYLTRRYDDQPRPMITPLKETLKAESQKAKDVGNQLFVQSLDKLYNLAIKAERTWATSEEKRQEEENKLEEFEFGFELMKLTPIDKNGVKIPKAERLIEPTGAPVGQIVYLAPVYHEEYERELDDEELHDDAFVKMDYRKEQEQVGIFKRLWRAILNEPQHQMIDPDPKPAAEQKKPAAPAQRVALDPVDPVANDEDKPLAPRVSVLKKAAAKAAAPAVEEDEVPPPLPRRALPVLDDAVNPDEQKNEPAAADVPLPPPPPPPPQVNDEGAPAVSKPAAKPPAPQLKKAAAKPVPPLKKAAAKAAPSIFDQIKKGVQLKPVASNAEVSEDNAAAPAVVQSMVASAPMSMILARRGAVNGDDQGAEEEENNDFNDENIEKSKKIS